MDPDRILFFIATALLLFRALQILLIYNFEKQELLQAMANGYCNDGLRARH